nr:hypothetical protein [Tanacetum cinerariifolium]
EGGSGRLSLHQLLNTFKKTFLLLKTPFLLVMLEEDLAKKLQAELEAKFARQHEELTQKAQVKSVDSPAVQGIGLSAQRRRELDAAQLIYTEADWFELMAKISTNSALSKQLLGDDRNLERSTLLNFKRTTFRPKPTLEAPSTKRARQGVPQAVHIASLQVPTSVPAAPSIAADVTVSIVSITTADVFAATSIAGGPSPSVAEDPTTPTQALPVTPDLAAVFAHADTDVHADESRPDDNQPTSEQVSAEHTVDLSTTVAFTSGVSYATPLSSRRRSKQIAKKRVTSIMDVVDVALIKFDSA